MIIHSLWAHIAREHRISRDHRRLEALSDAVLKDIGVTRHDLRAMLRRGHPPPNAAARRRPPGIRTAPRP